ncbi:MAG: hypothetical protein D6725_02770 [Planctomycetota bacterium]|nr:MAG: hypothetical protein D6725_02770 [Planctomycetota bacterium]
MDSADHAGKHTANPVARNRRSSRFARTCGPVAVRRDGSPRIAGRRRSHPIRTPHGGPRRPEGRHSLRFVAVVNAGH